MQTGSCRTHPLSFIPRGWDWRILSQRKRWGNWWIDYLFVNLYEEQLDVHTSLSTQNKPVIVIKIKSRKEETQTYGYQVQGKQEKLCTVLSCRVFHSRVVGQAGYPPELRIQEETVWIWILENLSWEKVCSQVEPQSRKHRVGTLISQHGFASHCLSMSPLSVAALGNKQQGGFFF